MGRSPCCDKTKVKRGSWSPEEDAALKDYLHNHGTGGNWIALPQKAGLKRCGKSCRLRWLNYLRPDIKHGAFTQEEEKTIFRLYDILGSRWSVIASHLPGRTDNDVKNYWNTKLKKKLLPELGCSHTTCTTTTTVAGDAPTLHASINSVPTPSPQPTTDHPRTFSNDPNYSPTPRIVCKDSDEHLNQNIIVCKDSDEHLNQNITSSSSLSHQDSPNSMPYTLERDEYYGVKGTPVDEYSYEVPFGLWSSLEAIEVERNADFAHLFPF